MSPLAIDEAKMQGDSTMRILSLDPAKPPTKSIPHHHFPLVVYKHPLEKFTTIEHRNAKHELVEEEVVPTEHLTRAVHCKDHANGGPKNCEACQAELKSALKDGWVEEPYIPETPPDPRARLYEQRGKARTEPKTA